MSVCIYVFMQMVQQIQIEDKILHEVCVCSCSPNLYKTKLAKIHTATHTTLTYIYKWPSYIKNNIIDSE